MLIASGKSAGMALDHNNHYSVPARPSRNREVYYKLPYTVTLPVVTQ